MIQDTNKPILIGGIGEPTWESNGRKTWQQGRRIYDTDGVAITISAVGGGIGGHAGLYIVEEKDKNTP